MCTVGVWKDRDEMANPLQKHDVELIKDDKRYSLQFLVPGSIAAHYYCCKQGGAGG